jgi:hypothetical protein
MTAFDYLSYEYQISCPFNAITVRHSSGHRLTHPHKAFSRSANAFARADNRRGKSLDAM